MPRTRRGVQFGTGDSQRFADEREGLEAAPARNAFTKAALDHHRAMRAEMERPIKMNIEAPTAPPQNRATRQRVSRQQARWAGEDNLANSRYSSHADIGFS
jgi:hypothetical protein